MVIRVKHLLKGSANMSQVANLKMNLSMKMKKQSLLPNVI